jgi:hypothetical protein
MPRTRTVFVWLAIGVTAIQNRLLPASTGHAQGAIVATAQPNDEEEAM